MYLPSFLFQYPVCKVVSGGKREFENLTVTAPLSTSSFKVLLLGLQRSKLFLFTSELRKFFSQPKRVLAKAANEIAKCKIGSLQAFTVATGQAGRESYISVQVNPQLPAILDWDNNYEFISDAYFAKTSNSQPYDLLALFLSRKEGWAHYESFLVPYLYGVKIERLIAVDDDKVSRVYSKIMRANRYLLNAFKKFNIKVEYKLSKAPLGSRTVKIFSYIRILGRE